MIKKLKIFEDESLVYEGNLSVNTAILKGRLTKAPITNGKAVCFNLQISGGKNPQTDSWNKPTYVDCSAFGELGEIISERYCEHDEIWFIGKFYTRSYDDKVYKGFIVRELINVKEKPSSDFENVDLTSDEDLPF